MGPVSGSKSENTLHMQQSWAVCDPKKKKKSSNEMVEDMIVIACNSDQLGMYDDDDS